MYSFLNNLKISGSGWNRKKSLAGTVLVEILTFFRAESRLMSCGPGPDKVGLCTPLLQTDERAYELITREE